MSEKIAIALALFPAALVIAGLAGWIMNIVQIIHAVHGIGISNIGVYLIIKMIGIIVAPLGAVLGWVGI